MQDTPDGRTRAHEETGRLVAAAQQGDTESFASLYAHIAPAVHAWACLRIRPALRTHFEPADLVQEVWFRAWKGLHTLDPKTSPFRHWVFRIAKNVLLEGIRRLRDEDNKKVSSNPSSRLFTLQSLPDSATAVSRRLMRDESLASFVDYVAAFDEEDKRLVVHVGLEGLSYREAGARLGLEKDAVAKRWQRLRDRLRERGVPEVLEPLLE